jgi:predicted  nucleic acid-binding Zn-ribbon protein
LFYLKGGTVAKIVEELQSGYDDLVQQREKLLLEIARVSEDLAKARGVVLSEVDAFARARALSLRLSELAKERDALTLQIERVRVQPQQAQA